MKNTKYHNVGIIPKIKQQNRYPQHTNTWPLTFLAWYRYDNKTWRG